MFTCMDRETGCMVTVYAVDFNHDAFLVAKKGKFAWVCMGDYAPVL